MPIDFVLPKKNEQELIDEAKKCGFTKIILGYHSIEECFGSQKKFSLQKNVSIALIISSQKKALVAEQTKKAHKKGILSFVYASSQQFDRFVIEKTRATALLNPEFVHEKDHLHFRRSGLDQVLCRFAEKRNKMFSVSLKFLHESKKEKVIGRIIQNFFLCKKYKVPYAIFSFASTPLELRSHHDIKSFMLSCGADAHLYKKVEEFFK